MRYRLRTLLIVVTLCCIYFAWVAYARRMTAFHRRETDALASRIVVETRGPPVGIDRAISLLASPKSNAWIDQGRERTRIVLERSGSTVEIVVTDYDDWERLTNHKHSADTYEQAAFQPWKMLSWHRKS